MANSWRVASFIIGFFSIMVLSIQSMVSIDRDLRARQTRMKNQIF